MEIVNEYVQARQVIYDHVNYDGGSGDEAFLFKLEDRWFSEENSIYWLDEDGDAYQEEMYGNSPIYEGENLVLIPMEDQFLIFRKERKLSREEFDKYY